MRVFKTKEFARFARRQRIGDDALCTAIERAERGLIDADLGGGVIKQRVPRKGQGRSGGFRTLIAFRRADRALFIFGFAKSDMDNIADDQLAALKEAAQLAFDADDTAIERLLDIKEWQEMQCDG